MMPHGDAEHRRMLGTPCIGWNGAAKDGRTSGCAVSGQFQSFTAQLWREGKVYQDELSSELICFKLAKGLPTCFQSCLYNKVCLCHASLALLPARQRPDTQGLTGEPHKSL